MWKWRKQFQIKSRKINDTSFINGARACEDRADDGFPWNVGINEMCSARFSHRAASILKPIFCLRYLSLSLSLSLPIWSYSIRRIVFFSGRASVSACMCASVWLLVWLIAANFMLTCAQPVPAVYWQKKTNFRKQECWPGYKPQHGDGNDDEDDDWPQPGPSYSHGTGSAGCQPQGIRLMNV